MQQIKEIIHITGRGYVAVVPQDDNYKPNCTITVYQDNTHIGNFTIIGIEKACGLYEFPQRGLLLKGDCSMIKPGMIIEKD